MPKMKPHKGLSKRIKVTANKKLKIRKPNGSHLMSGMSPKRRRKLGKPAFIDESIARNYRRALCAE